jgi:hypothetical protein
MPQIKFDYLIEAIHYSPDGVLEKVRLYEKRGPSFSDRVMMNRDQLIHILRTGKKVVTGSRQAYLGSTFTLTGEIQLSGSKDVPTIVLGEEPSRQDSLAGLPIF